jgi:hypothetical protein
MHVIKNVEERKCMIHRLSQTFLHTPSLVPRSFGVRRATAKSGSRRYCKPPPWLLYIWAWHSGAFASNCLLFLRNESPTPTLEHKQVEEMRRGVYSRGKWDPVFASKKRYLEFEQRGRKAVDDIFLKVRHMYLGLLDPANAIRGGGTGLGTNLRRLTERPLTEPDP